MIGSALGGVEVNFLGGISVVVLVGLMGWGFRSIKKELKPLKRVAVIEARQASMHRAQTLIVEHVATLAANGGSSLRDSIDRNEVMTREILKAVGE